MYKRQPVGRLRPLHLGAAQRQLRVDHVQRRGLPLAKGQFLQPQAFARLRDGTVQQQKLLACGVQFVPGLADTQDDLCLLYTSRCV